MNLLDRFVPRSEFDSYEDFIANYKVNVPEKFNFAYDVVDEYARLVPDKLALVWCDDFGHEERLTFKDMSLLSNRVANVYRSLGIKKGDTVLLMLKQRIEAWACMLGLYKIGAVCIPASFQLTPHDIIYRCETAEIKMITCVDDDNILKNIADCGDKIPSVQHIGVVGEKIPEGPRYLNFREEIKKASDQHERPSGADEIHNDDPMLIYFTSGTSGMPKMVLHDYAYPLGQITTAKYMNCVQDDGLHLTQSDSGWAKFAWGKMYGQWICGSAVVGYDTEKFTPKLMLEMIDRIQLTTFCAPPTIYRFLIKEDMSSYNFSSIKHASTAGEPLSPEVIYRFKEATGLTIHEGFGQSETPVLLCNFPWFDIKPGSTGKPTALYDIDIVDENGNSCEDGVVGSIVIKNTDKFHPPGLFKCYHKAPEAMAKSWPNGTYNTGDMAWRDSEGFFYFEGRNDDVIKCSGYRIGPFEVESALQSHPSVLECAVTAAPDPVRGNVVKATIVLAKGFTPSDELKKELQNHVKKETAPYKYPRIVEFVEELPKTHSGKIRRVAIRQQNQQDAQQQK